MKKIDYMQTLFLFIIFLWASKIGYSQKIDTWPCYGHDPALTGRSLLKGCITQPQVKWQYSVAGKRVQVQITLAEYSCELDLSAAGEIQISTPILSIAETRTADVDGSGILRSLTETYHERWAKIFPNIPGLQRVNWSHTWNEEKIARLQLWAYDQGMDHPRRLWESEPEGVIFSPLNIVYDIDGDGVQEICVAAHYRIMVFDGGTGRKESELKYHNCRPYGWFGLADVDEDSQMELITIGDFQSHIDVVDYDPTQPEEQRLRVKWRRDIETQIEERRKWPQIGPRPVIDVTGNSRPELVLNLYNDQNDNQWHTVVLDASSGLTLFDFPKRCLQGSVDVDGDGKAELFLMETDGLFVPTLGGIELAQLPASGKKILWSDDCAEWIKANLNEFGSTWSTTATNGMEQVLIAQSEKNPPVFLIRKLPNLPGENEENSSLTAWQWGANGEIVPLWTVSGFPRDLDVLTLQFLPNSTAPSALVRLDLPAHSNRKLSGKKVQIAAINSRSLGVRSSAPIAARLHADGPASIVAEGGAETIFAVDPPDGDRKSPRLLWQRPGRGMGNQESVEYWPTAVDLDQDGRDEIVAAVSSPTGFARLTAYRYDGSILWNHDFLQTPGKRPIWNLGALTYWRQGKFVQTDRSELFVNIRRGLMHSDVGILLEGKTGKPLWRQEKAVAPFEFSWGYAGSAVAVADMNNDGLDELVNLYPVCFWIARGSDGALIAAKELASKKQIPAWAAYGEPMVHDFIPGGSPEILLDSPYILALLDAQGNPIWYGPSNQAGNTPAKVQDPGATTEFRHALVDFDGDGICEIASAGYLDGVHAVDPRSGKVLWALDAPKPTSHKMAAADLDGIGGDELLYTAQNEIVVVTGDRNSGKILWTWKYSANLSSPIFADVDDDGKGEIIVQSQNGDVMVLE